MRNEWKRHAEVDSPLVNPAFAAGTNAGIGGLDDDDIAAMTATITAEPREVMWQLCRAGDISLLDAGANEVAAVRFAPRAVLSRVGGAFSFPTEWISSTRHAGVLRLVPLRRGVVRRTWSTDDELVAEPLVGDLVAGGGHVEGEETP